MFYREPLLSGQLFGDLEAGSRPEGGSQGDERGHLRGLCLRGHMTTPGGVCASVSSHSLEVMSPARALLAEV